MSTYSLLNTVLLLETICWAFIGIQDLFTGGGSKFCLYGMKHSDESLKKKKIC